MRRRELLAGLPFLFACGIVSFDVTTNVPDQTVTGNPVGGLLPAFLPNPFSLNVDIKAETQKRNTGPATSANIKAIQFQSTPHASPSGTFDFVDAIHIFVEAPMLDRKEVASLDPVPKGRAAIDLAIISNVDILPYVSAGATLSATATGRQPGKTFTFDGAVTITVHV
jgi:hypothetical protein